MMFSIIILTYNSETTIGTTIESALPLSDDIHVVDSYSSDRTCQIVRSHGIPVVQHAFQNYAAQRNWAIDFLPLTYGWQLHLDADERVSAPLAAELEELKSSEPPADIHGYCVPVSSGSWADRCAMAECFRFGICVSSGAGMADARSGSTTNILWSTVKLRSSEVRLLTIFACRSASGWSVIIAGPTRRFMNCSILPSRQAYVRISRATPSSERDISKTLTTGRLCSCGRAFYSFTAISFGLVFSTALKD